MKEGKALPFHVLTMTSGLYGIHLRSIHCSLLRYSCISSVKIMARPSLPP